ncbi:alkaline phosphatase family protein [Halosimplex salinum]|uniref:alkaline phosphatase family protein n=1 Tax=Halosimplex salinum TaxID=1710538 RepID=UPI000F480D8D|nr:alkaline phosphatase family protein [Halosimplex salinum]
MLRTDVERSLLDEGYLFPDYEGYCFANVNPTALSLLGADCDRRLPERVFEGVDTDVDRVVLVFLDGYGWEHWKRDHADVPLLSAFSERGTVTPLTSIYPSETAAATTTFHTGRTPVEHGVLGWDQYVQEIDAPLQVLPFATRNGDPADEAYPEYDRESLYEGSSIYERAAADGVESRHFHPFDAHNPSAGATERTYDTVADLGVDLRQELETEDGADYLFAYLPQIDEIAHAVGTGDERYRARLQMVTECLRREVVEGVDPAVAERTLVLLTADHGIVDTVPDENVDLRGDDELWDALRRDGDGDPIPPVGSPRNCHLFLRDGTVDRVRERIESRYPCRTFTREEAIERGLFGDAEPSDLFRRRCGDLIVVHRDRGMWYSEDELSLVGMHGGLTREEMLVPFAAARVSDLRE